MKLAFVPPRLLGAGLLVLVAVVSCFAEPSGLDSSAAGGRAMGGSPMQTSNGGTLDDELAGGTAGTPPALPACYARPLVEGADCKPVRSLEPMRLRLIEGVPRDKQVFVDDLFARVKSQCGTCHFANSLGGFQFTRGTFSDVIDAKVIAAITSDRESCELDNNGEKVDKDCYAFMPPAGSFGKPWSEREADPNDAVSRLVGMLQAWMAKGSPTDVFELPANEAGDPLYVQDEALASGMTNLGNCVPDAGLFATELEESCALDARFAALERNAAGGPEEKLGLPARLEQTDLTTFDSKELARHGVVAYSPTYPLWADNAGKLRHVRVPRGYDENGEPLSIRYNETTHEFDIPDNTRFYKTFTRKIKTLDGTERYRKMETRLIVVRANNQSLFGTYKWSPDEAEATLVTDPLNNGQPFADTLETVIIDEPHAADIQRRLDAGEYGKYANITYRLDKDHVLRRYAIPGSERCIQCHQGSPSESFTLGFSPLQVNHRPCDAATLQKNGHCEGGVLEAVGEDEVNQLERLVDYGVITAYDPEHVRHKLEDPQGTRRARRNMRSEAELVAQGYMLGNCSHCHNPAGYATNQNPELGDMLNFVPGAEGGIFQFPLERYSPRIKAGADASVDIPYITPHLHPLGPDKVVGTPGPDGEITQVPIPAPWRSLIYRNVDTPFTYSDGAIYPHMPLNTPGYDCRIARIMGDWMVSIPAVPKDYGEPLTAGKSQPLVEIKEGDPDYLNALGQAQIRLEEFHDGQRGKYCPDTSDIVDIDVMRNLRLIPADGTVKGAPVDNVPDKPHYVVTDLTDAPPPWYPRRADWDKVVLEGGEVPPMNPSDLGIDSIVEAWKSQVEAVGLLRHAQIGDELRKFATTPLPFALWEKNEDCTYPGSRKAGSFQGKDRPLWMASAKVDPERPVFETLPGAAVFNMICVNCHGPEADSTGRQASTLQEMTGGTARVANFRDGLFGPFGQHGENRLRVFGGAAKNDKLAEKNASHYLAWMALGGTAAKIPAPILGLVAQTPVAGERRLGVNVTTANMLDVARSLCQAVGKLGVHGGKGVFKPAELATQEVYDALINATYSLIAKNGDAELWQKLCTFDNPAPIHVIRVEGAGNGLTLQADVNELYCSKAFEYQSERFSCPNGYPANAPVGNIRGGIEPSLREDNSMPWCVATPAAAEQKAWVEEHGYPQCPPSFVIDENKFPRETGVKVWAARGAINAGFAVYLYLNDFLSEGHLRGYRYNECRLYEDALAMSGSRP